MSENIEKLFKTALEQVSVEPPTRVWEGINSHFVMKQRRRRRLFAYSGIAAAIALLLCVGYFMPNDQKNSYTPSLVTRVVESNDTLNDHPVLAIISSPPSIPPVNKKYPDTNIRQVKTLPIQSVNEIYGERLKIDEPKGELKSPPVRSAFIPLVNQNAIDNQKKYQYILSGKNTEKTPKVKQNEARKFTIGGYVSPGYSTGSYHSSNTNVRSVQYDESQMSGIFNLGGGVTFAVKPSKRISIETGVSYSRMGQKTDETPVFVPQVSMAAYNANTQSYTPLGAVKNRAKAMISMPETLMLSKSEREQNGSIEQQFDAIEVPLLFRYHVNDNRVKFSLLGGFGASFLVRNQTYVSYNGSKELMGETQNIRNFNITTNLGLGIEYPLSKNIHFKLEPGFKYYLQSLSKDKQIDFKPYSFTFSTGIGINF